MNRKLLFTAMTAALVSLSANAQSKVNVTDLDVTKTYQEYGKVTIGKSVTGEAATGV